MNQDILSAFLLDAGIIKYGITDFDKVMLSEQKKFAELIIRKCVKLTIDAPLNPEHTVIFDRFTRADEIFDYFQLDR
jgi:hypothetical protein